MGAGRTVAVFGATGHTGRFVVAELRARGFVPLLVGRNEEKLRALAEGQPAPGAGAGAGPGSGPGPEWSVRVASVDEPASLDRAFVGADAVVNCAGPFAETAAPVIEAALRAGIPYVDVAAEIEANLDTFAEFGERARAAGVVVVPAMAFFGGLGDLLVTAATDSAGWAAADEAHIAYGLSGWHPTAGTRDAGAVSRRRRGGQRVRYADGQLEYRDDAAPATKWDFPEPMGTRAVIGEFSMADIVTVPSHLAVPEVRTYMTVEAASELAAPDTPAPAAVDEQGRSAQTFVVDVVVRSGGVERRATARGQDIYAVSAPLAVEAVRRVIEGRVKGAGVRSAGAAFDAADFLRALSGHVSVEW
ncbi:saccharopine dehydrogenase NADP-binding domain-containing protein [Streptomyces sp. SP18BB07]|uniref:saccharopine dehydrogenase NADP-binding domain-containing protein n=1 Tax=Streptomyces sp. SP18BB07 TaxID=3002522 RepID=UPI002E784297|nr:saccharopine dehydrogenase NADP-binding domain-containing protein [Streptomyces sp. SP18BB07]MEE1763518.1 saccharopine dehydrogenase NADP-binding domain-containing protein [Streptomyces sp. SP18BB07]